MPILLILTTGLWCIIFSVFAFGFDTDPETCLADNKNDILPYRFPFIDEQIEADTSSDYSMDISGPAPDKNPDIVDVAVRFKFFFYTGFLLSCIQLGIAIVVIFVRHLENWFKKLSELLSTLAGFSILLLWIYGFTVRYMHSGCECSGDFIVSKNKAKNLLYVEGMFLKFSSLLVFFIMVLYAMGNVINCY